MRAIALGRHAYQRKYNHEHSALNGQFTSGSFPSSKAFAQAHLESFSSGGQSSQTYSTNINGEKYFVKSQPLKATSIEQTASKMGQDIGAPILEAKMMKQGGKPYLVIPWTSMKTASDLPKSEFEKIATDLSLEKFTVIHAYEHLMNDGDRHPGNFLVDPKTGDVKIIDLAFAFGAEYPRFTSTGSALDNARSKGMGVDEYGLRLVRPHNLPLDTKTLREAVAKTTHFMDYMRKMPGVHDSQIAAMKKRLAMLTLASEQQTMTTGGLQEMRLKVKG